jgi:hypothetical protein
MGDVFVSGTKISFYSSEYSTGTGTYQWSLSNGGLTFRQAANNVAEPGLLPAVAWLVRYLQKPTTSAFLARLNVAALARAANKKGEVRKLDAGDEWLPSFLRCRPGARVSGRPLPNGALAPGRRLIAAGVAASSSSAGRGHCTAGNEPFRNIPKLSARTTPGIAYASSQ